MKPLRGKRTELATRRVGFSGPASTRPPRFGSCHWLVTASAGLAGAVCRVRAAHFRRVRVNVGCERSRRFRGKGKLALRGRPLQSLERTFRARSRSRGACHPAFGQGGCPPDFSAGCLTWRTARSASDLLPVEETVRDTMRPGRWR